MMGREREQSDRRTIMKVFTDGTSFGIPREWLDFLAVPRHIRQATLTVIAKDKHAAGQLLLDAGYGSAEHAVKGLRMMPSKHLPRPIQLLIAADVIDPAVPGVYVWHHFGKGTLIGRVTRNGQIEIAGRVAHDDKRGTYVVPALVEHACFADGDSWPEHTGTGATCDRCGMPLTHATPPQDETPAPAPSEHKTVAAQLRDLVDEIDGMFGSGADLQWALETVQRKLAAIVDTIPDKVEVLATPDELIRAAAGRVISVPTATGDSVTLRIPTAEEYRESADRGVAWHLANGITPPPPQSDDDVARMIRPLPL